MNDIDYQISFVSGAVNRILWQIDSDLLSSTFGCAHLAYWRDKTSGVADMRRQEVMLPLAFIYSRDYPSSLWRGNKKLRDAIEALLFFWCKNQYPDGSMDEWYKGERAFAAAAFSTHAVTRTLIMIRGVLSKECVALATEGIKRTARWLAEHNDLFKTNHQAVGVAALAWAAEFLRNDFLKNNAQQKLKSILCNQTKEGWFPEIGHMDIGYTFLTVEFVLMAMELWGDWEHIDPFRRAFDFACEWIHPDLSVGREYGICQNTYISRIAVILMSRFSNYAIYLRQIIEKDSLGFDGYAPVLSDDLRLLRNSYQPFLADDYAKKNASQPLLKSEIIPLSISNVKTSVYKESGLVRFSCGGCTGIFAAVTGGLIRLFGNISGNVLSDYGYAIIINGGYATNYYYDRHIKVKEIDGCLVIERPILLINKFIPSFFARLVLHMACSTALGSRIARKGIDIMRRRKGTALNQSSANLCVSKPFGKMIRRVSFQKDSVVVIDELIFKKPLNKDKIFSLKSADNNWTVLYPATNRMQDSSEKIKSLKITKVFSPGDAWCLR